jgi:hypothetical protein
MVGNEQIKSKENRIRNIKARGEINKTCYEYIQ